MVQICQEKNRVLRLQFVRSYKKVLIKKIYGLPFALLNTFSGETMTETQKNTGGLKSHIAKDMV